MRWGTDKSIAIGTALLLSFIGTAEPSVPVDSDLLAQAQARLSAREYWASETSEGLQAPNREHGLRSYFYPTGVRVHERMGAGNGPLLGLKLVGVGRGARLSPVAAGAVTHHEGRVEIVRTDLGLTEWFENSEQGLEQGFTLARRPHGSIATSADVGDLVVELSVSGSRATLRGGEVELTTGAGRKLSYGKLVVVDAAGETLAAHFEVPDSDRILLVVDDRDASYPIVVDPLLAGTEDGSIESGQAEAFLGCSVASAGDVNGDGYDDVLVGSRFYDAGQGNEGAAFVFLGSANGIEFAHPGTAAAQLESNQGSAFFGSSVASAGDVNGDGYSDVIIGAPLYDGAGQFDEGAAFLYLGSASGIADGNPGTADARLESNQNGANLGFSVASAGDVNGDGFSDVIVGAYFYTATAGDDAEGAAFVFLGSAAGIPDGNPATAHAQLESNQDVAIMGNSVASAGDVNGDGYDDVIVGAYFYSAGQNREGAAFVFLGSASGIADGNPATAHAQLESNQANSEFGYSVSSAGDVNGDGYDDVVVGARLYGNGQSQEGGAFVFLGSANGVADGTPATAHQRLEPNVVGAQGGWAVASGDVNFDGYGDVIVGAPAYSGGQVNEGEFLVYLGSASGLDASPSIRIESQQASAGLGSGVAAGDLNGDGSDDVIVGAESYDGGGLTNEGAAFIFRGSAPGIVESVFGFEGTAQSNNAAIGFNFRPPDTMGAVGLTQFMEFSSGSVSVYDKTTGALQSRNSFQTFWQSAGAPIAGGYYSQSDQRVLFDHYTQRWIASGFGGTLDKINIAVSDTSDPLGTWRAVQYAGVAAGSVADFPTLGVDRNGVYVATSNFIAPAFTLASSTLTVVPKADLFGGVPTLANRTTITIPLGGASFPFTIQGAVNWNSSGNSGQFIANDAGLPGHLHFEVDGVDAPGASMSVPTVVGGEPFHPNSGARQPDGTRLVETLDDRPTANVVQVGDRLFVTNTVTRQLPPSIAFSSVRWQVIDATSGALIEEGDIGGGGYDYYQSSVAVNEFGEAVIAYNRSGPQTGDGNGDGRPDGRISFMAQVFTSDALGGLDAVGDPLMLRVSDVDDYRCGTHVYVDTTCRTRWGDTSAVTLDPGHHRTFYAIGEYAAPWVGSSVVDQRSEWHTYIAAIRLVPEPRQGVMLMVGLGALGASSRRRGARRVKVPLIRWARALVILVALVIAPLTARATNPGINGKIAYTDVVDEGTPLERRAVFIHGQGQFSHPTPRANANDSDSDPAWSPDGKLLAFVRRDGLTAQYGIFVVKEDGTELRQAFNTGQLVNGQPGQLAGRPLSFLSWMPNGRDILFASTLGTHRIFGAHVGTGLGAGSGGINVLLGQSTLEAGAHGILASCFGGALRVCVVDGLGGIEFFDLVLPGVSPSDFGGVADRSWWPRSNQKKVAFVASVREDGFFNSAIYSVEYNNANTDALRTRVTRVTEPPGLTACTNTVNGVPVTTQRPRYGYRDPVPSPDGKYVLVQRIESIPTYDEEDHCTFDSSTDLLQFRETGGLQLTLGEDSPFDDAAWQPTPANLAVKISDGHSHPLDDLKVELLGFTTGDPVGITPKTSAGGTYTFEDVPPGDYRVRATLTDAVGQSFEIRHGWPSVTAVWAETAAIVELDDSLVQLDFSFDASDLDVSDSNVSADLLHRLDDMAAIYFQMNQFVKWVRVNLTVDTGPLVPYYAFAAISPDFVPMPPDIGYHRIVEDAVYMGNELSDYASRDQPGDKAPENGEWHEFVHHLHHRFALPGTIQACPDAATLTNHSGWLNASSCDSLVEGFATFLAALAGGDSDYAGWFDLEDHTKAWDSLDLASPASNEDIAVAALLWDLVDTGPESETTLARLGPILTVGVNYTDAVALSLTDLWAVFTSSAPSTVFALQRALASQPQFQSLFWDLDGDGDLELNRADPLFLMHGFFPVARETAGGLKFNDYRYDYEGATFAGLPANEYVGNSAHYIMNPGVGGGVALDFSPLRSNKPLPEVSGFSLQALDASGTPLKNVSVELTIQYPDAETVLERTLPTGAGDPVSLRLPPYFNGFLVPGDPLPACDPAEDRQVSATVRGTINGYESLDAPSFDNCLYWHAVLAAGAGGPPFEYALSFPEDSMPPVTTASARTLGIERSFGPLVGDYALAGYWTVELSCDDPVDGDFASGCHRIEYSLDGGPFVPYEDEFDLVEPGLYTLDYRSFDAANNEESIRSRKLGIMSVSYSSVRPVTTLSSVASLPPVDGVTMGFWTVTMSCPAANSGTTPGAGCLRTEYSLDGGPFVTYTGAVVVSEPGVHFISYRSIDILNNQETTRSQVLIVGGPDITPPWTSVFADSPAPSPFDPSQAMGSWRVRLLACSDDTSQSPGQEVSGCASSEYSLDGGPLQPLLLASEVIIEGVGLHTFEYRSIDVAGNLEALQSISLEIVPSSDGDGDGLIDFTDNCPTLSNSDQADADGDGVGNACNDESDFDGDEWADGYDNCPVDSNPDQADLDVDGTGDVCDPFPEYTCHYPGWLPPSTDFLAAFQNNTCESWYGVSQPGADLRSAVLAAADLGYASLSGTNLSNADLTYANLYAADLSFAILTGATYNESTTFPSGNNYANAPWGLDGEVAPWNAGMVPLPEPSAGLMLLCGAGGLGALSMRQTTRQTMRKKRDVDRTPWRMGSIRGLFRTAAKLI